MNLVELTQHTQSEEAAEDYLRKMGILETFTQCPYCKGERVGKIRPGFYKCYHCRKEWSRRRGSKIEASRVPLQKVLLAIKLFELETSVRKASRQLELANNTTYGLYNLIRQIISPLTTENKRFSGEIEVERVTSEEEEKVNAAGELPTRSRYSGSWNVEGKCESMLLRMVRAIRSLILP
jgi:transposase